MTNHEGHIKLWDELARTGDDIWDKKAVFYHLFPHVADKFGYSCFACIEVGFTFNEEKFMNIPICRNCPIKWGNRKRKFQCEKEGSPYRKWREADTPEERKRLAAIIRDLPWREKK